MTQWETYHSGQAVANLGQQVISWTGTGLVLVAQIGTANYGLTTFACKCVGAQMTLSGAASATIGLYDGNTLVESKVISGPGPTPAPINPAVAPGAQRNVRVTLPLALLSNIVLALRWQAT